MHDEKPDEVFKALLGQKKDLVFGAGRGLQTEDAEGQDDIDFDDWTPPEDDEVSADGVAKRHRDNVLQTKLSKEGLQKRLTSLFYESHEIEGEQGVNVLYLALGFLKWFEDGRSEVERYAPLVLLPVELTREGARDRFRLKVRDEDLYTNVSLKVWLAEQHSIQLPDLPDTDEWEPSDYFDQVRAATRAADRWEVLEDEILLGFFSFSKFLLWRDLDPKNWPSPAALLEHSVLRKLLAPYEEKGIPDPPVIRPDERIDDKFKSADLKYVLDADSSQTTAIQTALAGRDLVVQGPPGTGKSQTIANMIAAAVADGKSVLFVAEKLAALQVVYERLRAAGLGSLCLELHSRKAAKQQVTAQLRDALNASAPPAAPAGLCSKLDAAGQKLWAHSDRFHNPHEPSGLTPYLVAGRISVLRDQGADVPNFNVVGAGGFSRQEIRSRLEEVTEFARRLVTSGTPAAHPWRGCRKNAINPLDGKRLLDLATKAAGSVTALDVILKSVWPLVRPGESAELKNLPLNDVDAVIAALMLAAEKPPESVELLCALRWRTDLAQLDELATVATRLGAISDELASIVVAAAWERDWTRERAEMAANRRSLFRVLRGPYRAAMREFRGVCRSDVPKTHERRIETLDLLAEGRELRIRMKALAMQLAPELDKIVPVLPGAAKRIVDLASWLRKATTLEPRLWVRNPRLLEWSDAPGKWANQLRSIVERARASIGEVGQFVALDDPAYPISREPITASLWDVTVRTRAWATSVERFNEWPPVRAGLERLATQTDGDFAPRVYAGKVQPSKLSPNIELAVMEVIWNAMRTKDPELELADGRQLDSEVGSFRALDAKWIKEAAKEVARKHFDRKPTGHVGDMAIIRGEVNKARKLRPVRKLIDQAGLAVQQLKPVFLMSPLSVAQYLAPGRLNFDLLLIDEASQVRPEDALGAIARAKQAIVVGDPKQLPPTNFFNRLVDDDDHDPDEDAEIGPTIQLGSMESILSLCDATFTTRAMLSWHYRSHHPALIAVSNRNFYDNRLLLPPSPLVERAGAGLGLVFNRTPGGAYDRGKSRTNATEANIVAAAVVAFARAYPTKSLGIGTFSVAQRDAIRDRLDAMRRADPTIEPFFSTNRPEPFMIKNLESIQGDERDVIFISVGYGRSADGRLVSSFGPINSDGGERRLNVLITRARERCEVFSSITADEIDVTNRKAGVVALKEFLQFAEKGYFDIPTRTEKTFDSDFEESVAMFLSQRGFKVDPQVGMAGFFIDLGVRNPADSGRYVLGVECDGATYHSSRSARDRDRIRQNILESRGWRIHRIWSTDWFHRRSGEERRLLDVLARVADEPPSAPAPPSTAPPTPPAASPQQPNNQTATVSGDQAPANGAGHADDHNDVLPYVEATFEVVSKYQPHDAPERTVHDAIRRIVAIEGPIHEDEVARRLATVWGLDRAGQRIQTRALEALRSLSTVGVLVGERRFWTLNPPPSTVPVRNRASTNSSTVRDADNIPPTEIVQAAREILKKNVRVPLDDLITEVARRLGFQRTGADLHAVIRTAVRSRMRDWIEQSPTGTVFVFRA